MVMKNSSRSTDLWVAWNTNSKFTSTVVFFVDIDEQHLTIHPIEFCASWHISAQVADDQVYSKAFEVSDVANTDHGLITFFRPKSSKVIADDVG